MPVLTVHQNSVTKKLSFEGTPKLSKLLESNEITSTHPCGGKGICKKCAVVVSGNISEPTVEEIKAGCRLSCQTVLLGDAEVFLENTAALKQIATDSGDLPKTLNPLPGKIGAAVDIGTTTVVLKLYDLQSGKLIGESAIANPQRSIAADVMGRIESALNGNLDLLKSQITNAVKSLINEAGKTNGQTAEVDIIVFSGNTAMLYLLTGRDPVSLSHAPFEADTLFDEETKILSINSYLPPCMNAFVGADITAAVLASGMCFSNETALLCDIGTNGEIALWKNGTLFVTSTAAGPAFEGAGISCGCGSIAGAIDRVWVKDDVIHAHTIDDAAAAGICGSGLIDAVAAFLKTGIIDETGAADDDLPFLSGDISLIPADIRALQLAKAAIAAGIQTLLEVSETDHDEIGTFYIAGGFGSKLDIENAAFIGLIPVELVSRTKVIGNAALSGTVSMLLDKNNITTAREIAKNSVHVNLGGNPLFNNNYIEHIMFPET